MAQAVLQIDALYSDEPLDGIIDSASFAQTGFSGGGRAGRMNQLGCRWKPSPKGAGSRVAGVSAIHQRLRLQADGYGGLVIFRSCRNLIRTLPAMVYSKTNPEDISPDCEEHGVKALMYGLTRRKTWSGRVRVRIRA